MVQGTRPATHVRNFSREAANPVIHRGTGDELKTMPPAGGRMVSEHVPPSPLPIRVRSSSLTAAVTRRDKAGVRQRLTSRVPAALLDQLGRGGAGEAQIELRALIGDRESDKGLRGMGSRVGAARSGREGEKKAGEEKRRQKDEERENQSGKGKTRRTERRDEEREKDLFKKITRL